MFPSTRMWAFKTIFRLSAETEDIVNKQSDGLWTDPDILRLMVNCSQMSEASKVSWGPTKPSNCSQKSLVSSTEAEKTLGRRDSQLLWGIGWRKSNILALYEQQNSQKYYKYQNKLTRERTIELNCINSSGGWLSEHLPLIIKQAAALIAWKRADECMLNGKSRSQRL